MEMTIDEIEMLNFFCFRLLNDFKNSTYNMPYLKFIFNDSDYEIIINYLENLENKKKAIYINIKPYLSNRIVPPVEIGKTIKLIKELKDEFIKNPDDKAIYIEIPNYIEFLKLLNELIISFDQNSEFNNFSATGLLHSVWLRMSPSDIANINTFLRKQISFTKNDYLIPTKEIVLKQIGGLYISYLNSGNNDWFETNRHIRPIIKRKVGEEGDGLLGSTNPYKYYSLPVIHYGLIKENNEPTCYVFGIQNLKGSIKDEVISEKIHEEKKRLRNKNVSPDFIIALKIFIDILKDRGITTIKVPLLQVLNYDFHKKMGEKYYNKMDNYSPERIKDLEMKNASDYAIREYENTKEKYEKYYNKEDMISANKTERLINTFYLVAENYDDLEIITEPFIESDNLICKINVQKEKNRHL